MPGATGLDLSRKKRLPRRLEPQQIPGRLVLHFSNHFADPTQEALLFPVVEQAPNRLPVSPCTRVMAR